MNQDEIGALVAALAPVIKNFVERKMQPIVTRLESVEANGLAFKGVYQRAIEYSKGSVIAHNGSAFVALRQVAPGEVPEECPGAWQLFVKRGRDARDQDRAR